MNIGITINIEKSKFMYTVFRKSAVNGSIIHNTSCHSHSIKGLHSQVYKIDLAHIEMHMSENTMKVTQLSKQHMKMDKIYQYHDHLNQRRTTVRPTQYKRTKHKMGRLYVRRQ
jgi:hypothetical protein